MRHFAHNIGDYAAATAHLSFIEDAAYHRCLRRYYQDERALPADVAAVARLVGARTKEERQAVANVLGEFFTVQDDGYHQNRADREIEAYQAKAQAARENGTKGGRPVNREKTKTVAAQVRSEKLTTPHSPFPKEEPLPAAASAPIAASVPVEPPQAAAADDQPTGAAEAQSAGVAATSGDQPDNPMPAFLRRTPDGPQAPVAERALVDEAFALWTPVANDIGISDAGFLNSTRRALLSQRLGEIGGIEGWKLFLVKVREAGFLRKPDGRPKFWVGLGKLLEPEHFSKVLEDRYVEHHSRDNDADERSTSAALAGLREELAR